MDGGVNFLHKVGDCAGRGLLCGLVVSRQQLSHHYVFRYTLLCYQKGE
jgi:hypothetical protein